MSMLRRLLGLLKPAFKYTERSLPVLMFLGFVFLIFAIWWFGADWRFFGKRPLDSDLAKVVATLVVLFVMGGVYMYVLIRRNRVMKKEKKQDEQDKIDKFLPYERYQEESLNGMLDTLKKNIPSRNYLYTLPWFLVIGQEDAGKTSLINRSSQKFSLTTVERTSKRYQKLKSPFKIDWWVSNDAILIDPDGELLSQQKDPDDELSPELSSRLWKHFISWLGKTRSRRPLNGIILTIDLPDLIQTSPSNREAMAGVMRTRIQEMIEILGTRLPVYVVFNKIDLVSGFDILFSKMKQSEREEKLGFAFSLNKGSDVDAWVKDFETQFHSFIKDLNEIVFDLMATTSNLDDREEMYAFSRQIVGMKEIIFQYVSDILESDRFSTPAIIRGVYFTSLFQQGVPHNLLNFSIASNYTLPVLMPTATPEMKQKTYFSSKLFHDVIYPEAGIAGDNIKVTRRKNIVFGVGSAIAAFGSLLIVAGWYYYYEENKESASQVIMLTKEFADEKIPEHIDVTGKNLLKPMGTIRSAALAFGDYRNATPVLEDLGLYQGRKIGPKIDKAYQEILSKRFLPALGIGLIDKMKTMDKKEIGGDEGLAVLRVYRMLEDKENRRNKIAEDWMRAMWQENYPSDGKTQEELMEHFSYAMDNVEADLSEFDGLIQRKQHEFRLTPLDRRVYRGIKQSADTVLYQPIDIRNKVGPAFDILYANELEGNTNKEGRYQIKSFFSKEGFKKYFIPQTENVMDLAMVDAWVLGNREAIIYSKEDQKVLSNKIRQNYTSDYISTWRQELNNLEVVDFTSISHAVGVLGAVTGSGHPFKRLLEAVEEQTTIYPALLKEDKEANAELLKDLNRKAASKVTRSFSTLVELLKSKKDKPAYIEELMTALGEVHTYTKGIQDAPNMGKASLLAAKNRLTLSGIDPIFSLKRIANGLPDPLNKQVNQIADNTWKVILVAAIEELERKWGKEVYGFYQERIASRYPFVKTSPVGVSLSDFEEFFGPEGRLQSFYDEYLKLFLEENKGALEFDGHGSLVRADFLDNLQAAWDIQDSFFNNKGSLHLEFSLEPLGLSGRYRRSVMNVDGQIVSYNHGPSYACRLIWPNTLREKVESKLTLISSKGTKKIRFTGPWSWFRLIDKANLVGATSKSINLRFSLGKGTMLYRLSSEDKNNPFVRKPFSSFSLPRQLLSNKTLNIN